MLKRDPIESTPEWRKINAEVEKELDEIFKDHPRGMGFCHLYWHEKARLLKEKYGIDWRSPARMNPRVMFD